MRELVGRITVDAGIVMVGDPCYTLPDDASDRNTVAKNWSDFCDATYNNESTEHRGVYKPFADGLALVVSSGYGDGTYPVYVEYEADSIWGARRIKSLTIEFIGAEDE